MNFSSFSNQIIHPCRPWVAGYPRKRYNHHPKEGRFIGRNRPFAVWRALAPLKGVPMKKITIPAFGFIFISILLLGMNSQQPGKAGDAALGTRKYDDFQTPQFCGTSCHTDIYQQWKQAMMSQAYTHHWDEIEYFKLAVPHAEKDQMVAAGKAGCNGCHAPIAFLAGDVPPPLPSANSRGNESVSCEVRHTITGCG